MERSLGGDASEPHIPIIFQWIIMDYHGLSWIIMDYHGLSWIIIIFPMKVAISRYPMVSPMFRQSQWA